MIIKSVNELDIKVGLLVYARPEVYIGKYFRHIKSRKSFLVYEVSLDARVADPDVLRPLNVSCGKGEIVEFVLCKEGISTIDAVRYATRALGLVLTYSGLKDAEARTCQFVRAVCTDDRELNSQYTLLRNKGKVELYTTGKAGELLFRGSLLGNYFVVLLNFTEGNYDYDEALRALSNVVEALPKLLLPNFFGYQRFGTRRPTTHLIGKALVECEFEEAVRYLVGYPLETESEVVTAARRAFEEGDLSRSIELFPKKFWIEKHIIRRLMKGWGPKKAILSLDRKILKLYIEAYQAYLFNLLLSTGLIEYDSIDVFARKCRVLPMPGPDTLRVSGKTSIGNDCSDLIRRILREVSYGDCCSTKEFRRLFSRKLRTTYFEVFRPGYKTSKEGVWLMFELMSGSYATILLRELLRENLILP